MSTRCMQIDRAGSLPFVAVVAVLLVAGCGGNSDRHAIHGQVTLDGQPLAAGYFSLRPMPGTRGPTAGAEIRDGQFRIEQAGGPFAGTMRVEITASRPGKSTFRDDAGMVQHSYEQFVPARYNTASELTAEVPTTNDAPLKFELTSR